MVVLALLVLAILGPSTVGVFVVKLLDQKRRDRDRRTFRLYFPNELDEAAITAWIRSISGTLRISGAKVTGVPSIAFELWATDEGLIHRLKVPWQQSDYVPAQLRSQMPGIQAIPEENWPEHDWTRAVEVGLTNSSRRCGSSRRLTSPRRSWRVSRRWSRMRRSSCSGSSRRPCRASFRYTRKPRATCSHTGI